MLLKRLERRLTASPTLRELVRRLPPRLQRQVKRLAPPSPAPPRSARSRGVRLILMYHRVAQPGADPFELCVSPARFRRQLEVLRSLGEVVPLDRLRDVPGPRLAAAITFDDGYADNALVAAPLLDAADAPATVFVVAGAVGSTAPFWWDRLAGFYFGGPGGDDRTRDYLAAWSRLRLLPLARIEEELQALEAARSPGPVPADARPVTEVELAALDGGPLEVGAHTLTHPSLPALPPLGQSSEIEGSRRVLGELLGRPVDSFAYPYGDYDSETVKLVRRHGFRTACSIYENRVSRLTSRLILPRFAVRDWTGEEFERRLLEWSAATSEPA